MISLYIIHVFFIIFPFIIKRVDLSLKKQVLMQSFQTSEEIKTG